MIISNSNFLLPSIEKHHPLSQDRLTYWKEQKRRCIEGFWSSGKWMPGPLYFFVNFWHIKLKEDENSKTEKIAKPWLRDLEWEKALIFAEARGFSGFSLDPKYTCHELYKPEVRRENEEFGLIPKNNLLYISPREYLRMYHGTNLGKALYRNQARNIIDIEARGGGKSYWGSCLIGHNFLFDGATDYDEYLSQKQAGTPLSSETLVGAFNVMYSTDLLSKVELGISLLPGEVKFGKKLYPSPLFQEYHGSFETNDYWEAYTEVKVGSNWIQKGSHSKIHHRNFKDKPTAGNGTRPSLVFLEEVGFMPNLEDSLGALKECTMNGSIKFGTVWCMGTGGAMASGATEASKEVFYNPEAYDCLSFEDKWENKKTIGFFVPVTLTLNQFKDKEGITDEPRAKAYSLKTREKLSKSKSKKPLNDELQNRPLVHSEAFLVTIGNRFPIKDLQARLAEVENNDLYRNAEEPGNFVVDEHGNLDFIVDYQLRPIYNFPLTKDDDESGCVVIYVRPQTDEFGNIPYGRYVAGNDPYNQSQAATSDSIGSTIIYDRFTKRIVAEYNGRPESYKEYYENVRKLLLYYNAQCLYENQVKGLFDYFDQKECLHLLYDQPNEVIKDVIKNSKVQREKGMHMSAALKEFGEELINTWLLESAEDVDNPEHKNLNKIRSVALLKELIAYNEDGNFDRVIALMMVMYQVRQLKKLTIQLIEDNTKIQNSKFFNSPLFNRNTGILQRW